MISKQFEKVSSTLEIFILYLNCFAKYAVLALGKFTEKAVYSTVVSDSAALNFPLDRAGSEGATCAITQAPGLRGLRSWLNALLLLS